MRLLIWTKGLTRADMIIEDVERILFYGESGSITYKLWDKTEHKVDGIERCMTFD